MEHTRKIQSVGKRSYAVSLPKEWIVKNNLDAKKSINIIESDNNLILSTKITQEERKIDIKIDDLKTIPNIIILAYSKGISELILEFKNNKTYLDAKIIVHKILKFMEGFKIEEEENHKIKIISFYKDSQIEIKKLAKMMLSSINQMIECEKNSQKETKKILENETDYLYYLSKRSLFICSTNEKIKIKNNIADIEEIFLWRTIFRKLENIGDVIEKSKMKNDDAKEIIEHLNEILILGKTPHTSKISELRNRLYDEKGTTKILELTIDILDCLLQIELNKKYFAINKL